MRKNVASVLRTTTRAVSPTPRASITVSTESTPQPKVSPYRLSTVAGKATTAESRKLRGVIGSGPP